MSPEKKPDYTIKPKYYREYIPGVRGTSTSIHGFSAHFKCGKPVMDEDGIIHLVKVLEEFEKLQKEFSTIVNECGLESMVHRCITEEENEKARLEMSYANLIYRALSGDELLTGNKNVGLAIDENYRITTKSSEESNRLIQFLGVKPMSKEGDYNVFSIDKNILEEKKKKAVNLSRQIIFLSKEITEKLYPASLERKKITSHKGSLNA